jgi:hypothetical protein
MRTFIALWIVIGAFAVAGCDSASKSGVNPLIPVVTPPYSPDTPKNALRLLEWSYGSRNAENYRRLFTSDFRFVFSDLDTNGAAYRDVHWTRDDELISASHLFEGGDLDQPEATDIRLTLDRNFQVRPDERVGKDPNWHVMITTQLVLHVLLSDGHVDDITGETKFFLTRGDSAAIPADLGVSPDPHSWYIDRWEDRTAQSGGGLIRSAASQRGSAPARVLAAGAMTWGRLKVLYR